MAVRIQQSNEPGCGCNCVRFYRNTIRLRKRIFEVYLKENSFSEAQAMAILLCMQAAGTRADEAVAAMAGLTRNSISSAPEARFSQIDHEAGTESDYGLWKILAHLQFKGWRGRRLKGRTLFLLIDTILLFWYPHGYLHLLRDDLTLRLEEYAAKEPVGRKRERWEWFYKAVKAAEMSTRRIWIALVDRPPERPPADWWLKIARQKGFTVQDTNALAL